MIAFAHWLRRPPLLFLWLLLNSGYHGHLAAATSPLAPPIRNSEYTFAHPVDSYSLPPELREISGQAWVNKAGSDGQLVCIEDETGDLLFYNLRTQRLDSTVRFAGPGDYEDVTAIPGGWLILRSDGTAFKRIGWVTTSFDTGLTDANEPEGLAYDVGTRTVLVACKGDAGAGLPTMKRAVYRLRLSTGRVEPSPAYLLDITEILSRSPGAVRSGKGRQKAGHRGQFAPSAVAIHPRTHHVFVLSARGNDLVELDGQGRLVGAQTLDPERFPQPEGLAFAPNGDLFISSEAGSPSGEGHLYRFAAQAPSSPTH